MRSWSLKFATEKERWKVVVPQVCIGKTSFKEGHRTCDRIWWIIGKSPHKSPKFDSQLFEKACTCLAANKPSRQGQSPKNPAFQARNLESSHKYCALLFSRFALRARRLGFSHSVKGERLVRNSSGLPITPLLGRMRIVSTQRLGTIRHRSAPDDCT